MVHPILILLAGIATVVGLILALRLNAFLSLICGAFVVSLLSPGETAEKAVRVAEAFGSAAGSIGIVIALAAVIGMCMLESGAADRIVRTFLNLFGVQRADSALLGSGFVLSIPVFFDTVFYLLVPLARSMYRQTGGHYARYIMVISAGAILTHSLVPPTPGPLVNAQNLGIDLGTLMLVGLIVAAPAAVVGLIVAGWIDRRLDIPMREDNTAPVNTSDAHLPALGYALLPIVLPVMLITANTIGQAVAPESGFSEWAALFGNANIAMLAAAVVALLIYVKQRSPSQAEFATQIERALMSGGLIILITSAGGAFGAMLQAAQIGPAIQALFGGNAGAGGLLLFLGFAIASLLKFAQGSSTVAIITASAMLGAMLTPDTLPFHPVYIATAIGSGSMIGSWMNDSGFWIISRMGGLSEIETFKTWSTIAATVGLAAFIVTLLLAAFVPLR